MEARREFWLAIALAGSVQGWAASAQAQIAASATLQTDYQFRGFSMSAGRPSLSLNASYDHEGAYFGVSAMGEDNGRDGVRALGDIEYAGYAIEKGGVSFDFGASNTSFIDYHAARNTLHYDEIYAGVNTASISAHLHYSGNYFSHDSQTLYADLDSVWRPAPRWRLFAHTGVLEYLTLPPSDSSSQPQGGSQLLHGQARQRYDFRAGVARSLEDWEVSLTLAKLSPYSRGPDRGSLVLAVTRHF